MDENTYETVRLPSKGLCYRRTSELRSGFVRVKYLTALDENVMVSKRHVTDGTVCDTLLADKIVGADYRDLCAGDKEAVVLWLRRTGYGDIYDGAPDGNAVDLGKVAYKEFTLSSDDEGVFTYRSRCNGDIRFRYLPYKDEDRIIKSVLDAIESGDAGEGAAYNEIYRKFAEPLLCAMVISVNGDDGHVSESVSSMGIEELTEIQKYVTANSPGLDLGTTHGIVFDDSVFYDITATGNI